MDQDHWDSYSSMEFVGYIVVGAELPRDLYMVDLVLSDS